MARELDEFCKVVRQCIRAIDAEMGKPSDVERGMRIAHITNKLDLSLDIFERYHMKLYTKTRIAGASRSVTDSD